MDINKELDLASKEIIAAGDLGKLKVKYGMLMRDLDAQYSKLKTANKTDKPMQSKQHISGMESILKKLGETAKEMNIQMRTSAESLSQAEVYK